jgi:hypothetical protein
MFVFGGIDADNFAMRHSYAFDIIDNAIIPLRESGEPPATRLGHGLLGQGGGMMLLYGGEDPSGRGSFSDLWHLRVHLKEKDKHVHYSQGKFKQDHEHYILSWRHGFTLHYLKNIEEAVMVGGTFGNGQQTPMMMTIPEKKCDSLDSFEKGDCSMCPKGKTINQLGICMPC